MERFKPGGEAFLFERNAQIRVLVLADASDEWTQAYRLQILETLNSDRSFEDYKPGTELDRVFDSLRAGPYPEWEVRAIAEVELEADMIGLNKELMA